MQPLNVVIYAAQQACKNVGIELIGFHKGWQGVLESSYLPLTRKSLDPTIGGTILRSSRVNLATVPESAGMVLKNLERLGVSGLIVVGGEDTLSNAFYLKDFPQVLISKTVDNDVGMIQQRGSGIQFSDIINYFTLGYPTAGLKISSLVSLNEGLRTTAYSHERIVVVESMGMHAGWLALSSCMGHPDFIVLPEFPLRYEHLLDRVIERYRSQKHLIIVVAEGSLWNDGQHLSADESETDSFGHPRFKGAADVLARKLKHDLEAHFETRNINSVNPSYLYRSGQPCSLDTVCAKKLGTKAVSLLARRSILPTFLTLKKDRKGFSVSEYPLAQLNSIHDFHRFVDERFYSPETYTATREAKKYLSQIIPEFKKKKYELN